MCRRWWSKALCSVRGSFTCHSGSSYRTSAAAIICWGASICSMTLSNVLMRALQLNFESHLSVKSSLWAQFSKLQFFQIQNIYTPSQGEKKVFFLFKFKFIHRREVEWRKWAIKFPNENNRFSTRALNSARRCCCIGAAWLNSDWANLALMFSVLVVFFFVCFTFFSPHDDWTRSTELHSTLPASFSAPSNEFN